MKKIVMNLSANMHAEKLKQKQKELETRNLIQSIEPNLSAESIDSLLRVEQIIDLLKHDVSVMSDNATIITSKDKYEKKSKFQKQDGIDAVNLKLHTDFAKPLLSYNPSLKKMQSGSELIDEVIQFNSIVYSYSKHTSSQNLAQMEKSMNKALADARIITHDTETMGGINEYGRRELDFITEFYAAEIDSDLNFKKEINGLVGLPKEFEADYKRAINDYITTGKLRSEKDSVIIKRLGLYGHGDTTIGYDEAGDAVIETFANTAEDYKFTRQELERGLDRLRNVWDENNSDAKRLDNGLFRWQQKFADYVSLLQNKETVKIDQNGGLADTPWINIFANSKYFTDDKYINTQAFKEAAGFGKHNIVRIDSELYGDMLSLSREADMVNEIYDTATKQRNRRKNKRGHFALENITEAVLPENEAIKGLQPHTAKMDSVQVARLVFEQLEQFKDANGMSQSYVQKALQVAQSKASTMRGEITGGNTNLFFATKTLNTGAGSKGYMSFIYDSLNNATRLATGANITDTTQKHDSWNQYPISKGDFYTLDWAGEVTVTDKWQKEIAKYYPEFDKKNIYVAKLNQVLDKNIASADTKNTSANFIVAESQEELIGQLSTLANVGRDESGQQQWKIIEEAKEEIKELLSVSEITPQGTIHKLTDNDDEIISRAIRVSTVMRANDKAARTAKEYNVKNFDKFKSFQAIIDDVVGSGATKKDANKVVERLLNGEEIQVAKAVASGQPITYTKNSLFNAIGYTDYKTKEQSLYSETLNKVLSSYDYYDSVMPVAEEIMSQIAEDDPNRDKKFAFAMNEFMNKVALDVREKDPKSAYSNTEKMYMFTKDTNRFMVDVSDIYNSDTKAKHINNVLSIQDANEIAINLNDRTGNSLISSLLRQSGYDKKSYSKGVEDQRSMTVLKGFVNKVSNKREYKDILEDIKLEEYQDPVLLARDIIGRFRDARENDDTRGRSKQENIFNATDPHRFRMSEYVANEEIRKNTVRDILLKVPNFVEYSSNDTYAFAGRAEELVSAKNKHLFKGLFFNGKEYKNINSMTKAMGYGEVEQRHYAKMFNQVQTEYKDFMTDLLSSLSRVEGGQIVYDNKNIKFIMNDLEYDLKRLPVISFEDGIFGAQIGGTKVSIQSVLDTSSAVTNGVFDPSKVKLSTNFKKAIKDVRFEYLEQYLDNGGNAIDWIKSMESKIYEEFTKGSPGLSTADLTEIEKSMHIKDSEIKAMLPMMKEQGMLQGIDKRLIDKIKPGENYEEYMNAEMGQLYQAERAKLWRIIAQNNKELQPILGHISTQVKANAISDNVKLGNMVINPLIQMQDYRRDVPGQERAIHMRTKDVQEGINKLGLENVTIGSYTATTASSKLRNRNLKGIVETSTDLSMRNLNMSDPMLREMIYQARKNSKYQEQLALTGEDYFEKVLQKLNSLNLIEGNSIIDPRIADIAFNYSDIQRVRMSKIQIHMNQDKNTFEQLKRYEKLAPEFKPENGVMKVKLSKGQKIKRDDFIPIEGPNGTISAKLANHDGSINLGWFINNTDVELTEDEINKIIKNAKTKEEAIQILKDKDIAAYTTVKYDSVPDMIKTIQDGGEKNMTQIPRFGIGQLDKRLEEYANSVNDINFGQVIDHREIGKTFKYDKAAGRKAGFSSEEEFWNIFYKERYSAMSVLQSVGKDLLGQDFSLVSANGNLKHENYGSILKHNFNAMVNAQKSALAATTSKDELQQKAIEIVKSQLDAEGFFKTMPSSIEGDQLILPSTLDENALPDINIMKKVIDENEIYSHIGKGLLYESDGESFVAGTVTDITVSQIRDHQNVTGRELGNNALEEHQRIADNLRTSIYVEDDPDKKRSMKKELLGIEEKISTIKQEIKNADKGRRISDRDMLMLNFDKLSQEWLNELQDSVDETTFKQIASDLIETKNGEFVKEDKYYKLQEGRSGEAVNKLLVDQRHKTYLLGNPGDKTITMKDLDQYKDRYVREGIGRIVAKNQEIRKDLAEVGYAIHQGLRAGEFKKGVRTVEDMESKFGFHKVSIDEFTPYVKNGYNELIENETASMGKNILLDLGENFGDESNPNRYVAMPYVPVKRLKDDTIRADFETKANNILIAKQKLDTFGSTNHKGSGDLEKLKANVLNAVDDYHAHMMNYMVGKEQLFGEYSSIRIHGSVSTKTASAMSYFEDDDASNPVIKLWTKRSKKGDMNLDDINFQGIKDAQVDGMSLLEHAKQGRYFDSKWVGEEAFEKMGVFNKDVMDQFGYTTREEMLEHLRTQGIEGEITRSPNIKTGSSVRGRIYYSNEAEANKAFVSIEGQLGRVGDNDGDYSIANLTTYDGKLNGPNRKDMTIEEENFWREQKRASYYKAAVTNQHWRKEAMDTIDKEFKNAKIGSSLSEVVEHLNSGFIVPELSALDAGVEVQKQLSTFKELEELLTEKGFDLNNSSIEQLDNWLADNAGDRAQEFRESFIFNMKYNKAQNTGMSKMLRSAIGEVNVPMHKARQTLELSMLYSTIEDQRISNVVQKTFEGIEQNIISYKKINSLIDAIDRVPGFEKAFYDITSGKSKKVYNGRIAMGEWLDKYAEDVLIDSAKQLSTKQHMFKGWDIDYSDTESDDYRRVYQEIKDMTIDGMESINNQKIAMAREAMKLGTITNIANANNVDASAILRKMPEETKSTFNSVLKGIISDAAPEGFEPEVDVIDKAHFLTRSEKTFIDDGLNYARQNDANAVKSILEDTGSKINHYLDDAMKNLTKSKFGAGALAFGAMFMFTGYMGGKPSEPAMDQSTNMAANEQGPMLSDFNMPQQSVPRQTNSGYVINIKGKGSPVAVQQSLNQIQQTAHQSFSTDVNVSMNITQSPGNIDDRTIEQMISDAIG